MAAVVTAFAGVTASAAATLRVMAASSDSVPFMDIRESDFALASRTRGLGTEALDQAECCTS